MKTLEEAKQILKLCNTFSNRSRHARSIGEHNCLCNCCCPECTTDSVLKWIWPELKEYTEELSDDEIEHIKENNIMVGCDDDE